MRIAAFASLLALSLAACSASMAPPPTPSPAPTAGPQGATTGSAMPAGAAMPGTNMPANRP